MAQNTRREIELALSVTTANADALSKLQQDVRALAKEGGEAAPAFQQLAYELGQLAQQAKQLTALEGLTQDLQAISAAQTEAAQKSSDLKQRLGELVAATEAARAAQQAKTKELNDSKRAIEESQDAIKLLKNNTDAASKSEAAYAQELARLTNEVLRSRAAKRDLATQLEELKANTREAARAVTEHGRAYREADKDARAATAAQRELQEQVNAAASKYREAGGASAELATAQKQLGDATAATRESIRAAIAEQDRLAVAAKAAAAEEIRLANMVAETKARMAAQAKVEADGIIADYRRMEQAQQQAAVASRAAGEAVSQAFGAVGQRSVKEINADIARVRESMQLLASSGAATGAELAQAMRSGKSEIAKLEKEIRQVTGSLSLADKASNLFANSLGQISAGNLIADAIGSLVEKVKEMGRQFVTSNLEVDRLTRTLTQITGTAQGAAQQIQFLRDVANKAGVSMSSVTDSFIRFQASASASGMAMNEVNAMFQAVTVAGSKMGVSNDRIALALDALSQIASKGTVSLEELRQQLGDSLPGAMSIAAKGLGVTSDQLIKMVESGNLAAKDFFPAFRKGLEDSFGSSDKAVQGLTQSFARLGNKFTELYQQAYDSTAWRALGTAVDAVTDNFNALVTTVGTLGKAWAALKILDFAKSIFGIGDASRKVAVDIAAQTAATVENSAAVSSNTTLVNANTQAKIANAGANTAAAASASKNAGAWKQLGDALADTTSKAGGTAGAMTTVATGTQQAGAAAGAAAAPTGLLARAMGALGLAARGLMGLLGGPMGLIALGVAFRQEIGEIAAKLVMWVTGQKNLEQSTKELEAAQRRELETTKELTAQRERQAAADRAAQEAKYGLNAAGKALIDTFDGLIKKGESTSEAIKKIGQDFDLSTVPGIQAASGVLDKLLTEGKITSEQFNAAWTQALQGVDLGTFEINFRSMLGGLEQAARKAGEEVEKAIAKGASPEVIAQLKTKADQAAQAVQNSGKRMAQVFDVTLNEAIRRTGLDVKLISDGMGKAAASSINDLDVIIGGLGQLKAQGVDASRVLTASLSKAIDTADGQKSLDLLRGKIEEVRSTLGDKIADGLLDQAKKKSQELKDALDAATPGINSVREAFKSLGIESDEALKETAKTAKEAYDTVKNSGTASAREINESWKVMAEASIKANDGVADSTIKSEAAARGFAIETNAAGKSVVKSLSEAKGAAKGVGDELGATGEKGKDALGKIDYAAQMAGKSLEELEKITRKNWDANRDLADQAAESNAAANEAGNAWLKQQQEQNKYYGEMVKILQKTRMGFAELNEAAWAGANALEALDKQQKAIEQSSSGAASELEAMKDKLAELDGDEETTARRRAERDKAEVQRKQALMQLDLQRAQIRKDDDEVARLSAELAAYQEQLRLIDQIAAKESQARQRKAREEKAAQRERDRAQEDAQKSRMDGVAEEGAARDAEAERLAQEAQKKLEDEMRKRQQAEDEALRKKRAAEDKAASERYEKERKALDDAEKQRQEALRREAEARAEARRQEDERIRLADAARVAREKADRDAAAKAAEAQEAQRADREAKAKKGARSTEEEAALARQRDAVLAAQKQQAEEQARLEAERAEAAAQARAKRLQDERSAEDKAAAERERIANEAHQKRLQELEEAERKRQERVQEERAREDERIAAQRERDAAMLKAMQDVAASVLAIAQASGAKVPLGGEQAGQAGAPGTPVMQPTGANDSIRTSGAGGGGGAGVSYVSKITIPGLGQTTAMFENQRDQRAFGKMLSALSSAARASQ